MQARLARGATTTSRRSGCRKRTGPSLPARAARALVMTFPLLATATPGAASDHPPLSEWPITIGSGPVDLHDNDGRSWQEPGRWSARDIQRTSDGHLRFTLSVTPAPVRLPVRSGPAVLFVGVGMYGGSGDVGFAQTVRVTRQAAPACRRDPCTYHFRVDADLSVLPAIAAAAPIDPYVQADIGFTLVRTFGDGTWLQVMKHFQTRPSRAVRPGRPLSGRISTMGLVPVRTADAWTEQQDGSTIDLARMVARSTWGLPDPSRPLRTVRVRLAVDAPGCWPYLRLAIHDDQAARPFDADLLGLDPAGTVVDVPDGLPWTVSLWQGGIFDGNETGGISVQAGDFTTAGEDLEVTAHYVCGEGAGSYSGSLTVAPAIEPLPSPTVLRQIEWTPALDGPRHGQRMLPFTVTSTPRGFVALGWDPDDGWTEWWSRDGARWRSRSIPTADGLPVPPDLLDVGLWSVDDTPRLTTIGAQPDGSRQLRVWRRTAPGRWSDEGGIDAGAGAGAAPPLEGAEVGSVGAFVGSGGTTLLLLVPEAGWTDAVRLLRRDATGAWQPSGPPDGTVTSVVSTPDGFTIAARTTADSGATDTLLTSADGLDWTPGGTLPTDGSGAAQLALVDGAWLAFATDGMGLTHGWRREPDGSWTPTLVALGSLFPGGVAADGRMVTVLTSIDDRGSDGFTAGAVSRDGGRTWQRGEAIDSAPGWCRMSLAIRPPMGVGGAGGCRARPAATRWAP